MSTPQEDRERVEAFKRNASLEGLLASLNDSLACAEGKVLASDLKGCQDHPVVFVMGPHRCGTTLFMQWLANTGVVAYPTNMLSRFYGAPVIGAQIQLLLTDPRYNFRNEIFDFNSAISFDSENGKTKGALAPNEFWYFWRRFLLFQELDWMSDDDLFRTVDQGKLVSELTMLTQVFNKPFALKSMILNYNIPFLDKIFEKAIFIQIKRDPVANVASILEARKRQLGSESDWYSFKIPEYPKLKDLDPVTQSAGQLHYINKAVSAGMEAVAEHKKLIINYEDFCMNPQTIFRQLLEKLGLEGMQDYSGCEQFDISRNKEQANYGAIQKALNIFRLEH